MYSKYKCVINIVNTREVQNKYQTSDNVNAFLQRGFRFNLLPQMVWKIRC